MFNEETEDFVDKFLNLVLWVCGTFGALCFIVLLGYAWGVING